MDTLSQTHNLDRTTFKELFMIYINGSPELSKKAWKKMMKYQNNAWLKCEEIQILSKRIRAFILQMALRANRKNIGHWEKLLPVALDHEMEKLARENIKKLKEK